MATIAPTKLEIDRSPEVGIVGESDSAGGEESVNKSLNVVGSGSEDHTTHSTPSTGEVTKGNKTAGNTATIEEENIQQQQQQQQQQQSEGGKKYEILFSSTSLRPCRAQPTKPGGSSLFCNRSPPISVDASNLPEKLVIVVNQSNYLTCQFFLASCCIGGAIGILGGWAGGIEEFHFVKNYDPKESSRSSSQGRVTMTKISRRFNNIITHPPCSVHGIGSEEDELLEENSSENSSESNDKKPGPNKALIVIDGHTGNKGKEDSFVVNNGKIVVGGLRKASPDEEGDASTLIKAFCSFPLTYDEYEWIEKNAPCLVPDVAAMTTKQARRHNVLMLQLRLQKIQILQEQQALGRVIDGQGLKLMAMQSETLRELSRLRDDEGAGTLMLEEVSELSE